MALILAVVQPSGVTLAYHRAAAVFCRLGDDCAVVVDSYLDEEARRAGAQQAASRSITVPAWELIEYVSLNPFTLAYRALKALAEFDGAEDC